MEYIQMTDEELAVAYVGGDNKAFDILLDRNKTKLYSYINFVVRNHAVADDIFQDTFVKVIVKLQKGQYQATGKFGAWLTRIAHNVIMDYYRAQDADNTQDVGEDNDMSQIEGERITETFREEKFINEQILCDVKNLMYQLPATQLEVVFMRFFQEMSFKEIAEATGVSINTALGRMHYAVRNLRRMMKTNDIQLSVA